MVRTDGKEGKGKGRGRKGKNSENGQLEQTEVVIGKCECSVRFSTETQGFSLKAGKSLNLR